MGMIWVGFKKWKTKLDSSGSTIPDLKTVINDGFKNNDVLQNGTDDGNLQAHVDETDWAAKSSLFTEPDYTLIP